MLYITLSETHDTFGTLQIVPFNFGDITAMLREKYSTCSRANRFALNSLQSKLVRSDLLEAVSLDLFPSEELFFFFPSPSGIERSPFPVFH